MKIKAQTRRQLLQSTSALAFKFLNFFKLLNFRCRAPVYAFIRFRLRFSTVRDRVDAITHKAVRGTFFLLKQTPPKALTT
jgi:hypothetical protein